MEIHGSSTPETVLMMPPNCRSFPHILKHADFKFWAVLCVIGGRFLTPEARKCAGKMMEEAISARPRTIIIFHDVLLIKMGVPPSNMNDPKYTSRMKTAAEVTTELKMRHRKCSKSGIRLVVTTTQRLPNVISSLTVLNVAKLTQNDEYGAAETQN